MLFSCKNISEERLKLTGELVCSVLNHLTMLHENISTKRKKSHFIIIWGNIIQVDFIIGTDSIIDPN